MGLPASKRYNALKHAGFSAATLIPGESAAEFEKLHQALVSEFRPRARSKKTSWLRWHTCSGAKKIFAPFALPSARVSA
jgi:hypothetical protein